MQISVEELSKPLSDEQPCGEDLEYDAAFQSMETALESRDEQEMGDATLEATGPDWAAVAEHAQDLLGRTRDMRVFVHLAVAGLNLKGVPAFHQVLVALNNNLDAVWDDVHPLLDPDDDFDPMMRMNVLQNLDDYENVRGGMRRSPLVELKGVGAFSLDDLDVARGLRPAAEGEDPPDLALITGAFADANLEELQATGDSVQGALDELARLAEIWSKKTDNYDQPGLDNTLSTLRDLQAALAEFAPAGVASVEEDAVTGEAGGAVAAAAVPGAINTPDDVIKTLDRICDYYRKNEPSSPIPVLLQRAKGLVSRDFFEILEDLAPDGIKQFEQIKGRSED